MKQRKAKPRQGTATVGLLPPLQSVSGASYLNVEDVFYSWQEYMPCSSVQNRKVPLLLSFDGSLESPLLRGGS